MLVHGLYHHRTAVGIGRHSRYWTRIGFLFLWFRTLDADDFSFFSKKTISRKNRSGFARPLRRLRWYTYYKGGGGGVFIFHLFAFKNKRIINNTVIIRYAKLNLIRRPHIVIIQNISVTRRIRTIIINVSDSSWNDGSNKKKKRIEKMNDFAYIYFLFYVMRTTDSLGFVYRTVFPEIYMRDAKSANRLQGKKTF